MNSIWQPFKEGFLGSFTLVAAIFVAIGDVLTAYANHELKPGELRPNRSSQV